MDVFDAQYLPMRNLFSREQTEIEVAYTLDGQVDHIYVVDQLLAVDRDDNIERLQRTLPGVRPTRRDELGDLGDRPMPGDLVVLSIDALEEGRLTVPEALDLLDERLGDDNPALHGGDPLATAVNVMHTAKLCAASEPAVPCGSPPQPCPPPRRAEEGRRHVRLGVCDTGLVANLNLGWCPWLVGVAGEEDPLVPPTVPGGLPSIPYDAGHGTFVAGVARCMAPEAAVYVGNHFTKSGGELEYVIVSKLEALIETESPDLVNLSAGTYTRNNWPLLSFSEFRRRHGDIILVAAAGNDSTNREFWPAASPLPWTIAVGSLGADRQNLAYFSNYGDWVDVYAPGEGLVNAFATGVYTYQEPPKRPSRQIFEGMARWDGTSFSAPLVAGLIAAEMSRTGVDAQTAAQAILTLAQSPSHAISGVGPALFPSDP